METEAERDGQSWEPIQNPEFLPIYCPQGNPLLCHWNFSSLGGLFPKLNILTSTTCCQRLLLCDEDWWDTVSEVLRMPCRQVRYKCHFNVLIIIKMSKMERTWFQRCCFNGNWEYGFWEQLVTTVPTSTIQVMSKPSTLFQNESHLPSPPHPHPGRVFVVLEIKLSLMTLSPKFILIYWLPPPIMPWPYRCVKKTFP